MAFVRALLHRSGPHKIAMGTAVGVAVATMPLPGLQVVLAVLLATALRGSRLAAATFVWLSNPLFFYLDYRLGRFLLEGLHLVDAAPADGPMLHELMSRLTTAFLLPVLAGCAIMALAAGLATYVVALRVVQHYREKIRRRARCRAG